MQVGLFLTSDESESRKTRKYKSIQKNYQSDLTNKERIAPGKKLAQVKVGMGFRRIENNAIFFNLWFFGTILWFFGTKAELSKFVG